jgi:NAD(P)H-flavin reductase
MEFKAGQYLDVTLLDPSETDSEGNVRRFSIASTPHEDTLMAVTRMRDTAFKRVLRTMPIGTAIKIEGPSGDLTLQNNYNSSLHKLFLDPTTSFRTLLAPLQQRWVWTGRRWRTFCWLGKGTGLATLVG